MSRSVTSRHLVSGFIAGAAALIAVAAPATLAAQTRILSSEISVSRGNAALKLELEDGRSLELALRDGRAYIDGADIGEATREGQLDRDWRDLLDRAINAPTNELAALLTGWSPRSSEVATRLDRALEEALAGVPIAAPSPTEPAPLSDSLERLVSRIQQLERHIEDLEENPIQIDVRAGDLRNAIGGRRGGGVFSRLWNGIEGTIAVLLLGTLLFGVGFTTVFFGGRRYIEGVSDTVRVSTTRSLLVGLAAMFLVVPAYILGMIALAISIVGIPALLLWIPLFPIAVCLAALLGYIGVAHAAGEALAERRFSGTDWFRRGNSYYFMMTGLGLLLALFIASQIVSITGIGFFAGALFGIGIVVTWAAVSIGLGAVLLSRGGSRPSGSRPVTAEPGIYAEEAHA